MKRPQPPKQLKLEDMGFKDVVPKQRERALKCLNCGWTGAWNELEYRGPERNMADGSRMAHCPNCHQHGHIYTLNEAKEGHTSDETKEATKHAR